MRRFRSVVIALVFALLLSGFIGTVGADRASAASGWCTYPYSWFRIDDRGGSQFIRGRGSFNCTNVNYVSYNIKLYYKLQASAEYQYITGTPWIGVGSTNGSISWTAYTNQVMAPCGFWKSVSTVRYKLDGSGSYTYRSDVGILSPNCG
jgi:hypothetical protein